jgi:uncharacterized protein YlxW (UPF0749 family)
VNEHERQYAETGTGWPGAAAEPTDIGWPQRGTAGGRPEEPAATVDAVPAAVTLTPDGRGTDKADEAGRAQRIDQAQRTDQDRAAEADPAPGRAPGSQPPPGSAAPPGSPGPDATDKTVDLGRADKTVDLGNAPGGPPGGGTGPRRPRLTSAGALIGVLIALLGFALAVQLRNHTADPALASARQEDLVRILSDLEAQEERARQEISGLEERQRQLTSGAQGRQAALEEATQRADELGILAGTLPAQGPGLTVRFTAGQENLRAEAVLDAIQELRGAGAEAMQIAGREGPAVRVVASTYVVDAGDGIEVDGRRLTAPYTITVIGDGQTMRTALNIAGGVVESVEQAGGTVTVHEPGTVKVTALHTSTAPRYARPAK